MSADQNFDREWLAVRDQVWRKVFVALEKHFSESGDAGALPGLKLPAADGKCSAADCQSAPLTSDFVPPDLSGPELI